MNQYRGLPDDIVKYLLENKDLQVERQNIISESQEIHEAEMRDMEFTQSEINYTYTV